MLDQEAQRLVHLGCLDQVVVVEDQGQVLDVFGDVVDDGGEGGASVVTDKVPQRL